MSVSRLPSLLAWLVICFAVAAFGAWFTPGEWYAAIHKPPWTPPNWLFGPVWTALYAMMAVAAWLVWCRRPEPGAHTAIGLFIAQLIINGLWSWLFFGLHWVGLALLDLLLLWVLLLATVIAFFRQHRLAGWLLVPYLLWVSYAVSLNAAIWVLN